MNTHAKKMFKVYFHLYLLLNVLSAQCGNKDSTESTKYVEELLKCPDYYFTGR
jgi:hypothetical protein